MPSKFLMKSSILDTVWCVGERDRVKRKLLYNETQQETNQAMLHNGTRDFTDGVHSSLGIDKSSLGMVEFSGSNGVPPGPWPWTFTSSTKCIPGFRQGTFSVQQGLRASLGSAQASTATTQAEGRAPRSDKWAAGFYPCFQRQLLN